MADKGWFRCCIESHGSSHSLILPGHAFATGMSLHLVVYCGVRRSYRMNQSLGVR